MLGVVTMPVPPAPAGSAAGAPALQLETQFETRLDAAPQVQAAARRNATPLAAGRPETGMITSPTMRRAARTSPSVPHPAGPQPAVAHSVTQLVWEADATSADPAEHIEDRLAQLAGALGPLRRVLAAIAEDLSRVSWKKGMA